MSAITGPLFQRLCELLNVSQAEFGKKTGIIQQTLSSLMAGKSKPGYETLAKIKKTYPLVNLNWLVAAEEPAFVDGTWSTGARALSAAQFLEEFGTEEQLLGDLNPAGAPPSLEVQLQRALADKVATQKENRRLIDQVAELKKEKADLMELVKTVARGKEDGNQPQAPGEPEQPRTEIKGFTSVRAMWPNGLPESDAEAA